MLEIMTYDLWIERTKAGITKPRSNALKEIDRKLQDYHSKGKSIELRNSLCKAIDNWKLEKGATWRSSIRNKNGAVSDLSQQANDEFELTDLDHQALRYLQDSRRQFVSQLFQGRELKLSSKVTTVVEVGSAAYQAGTVTNEVYQLAQKLVNSILGNAASDPLMQQMIQQVLGKSMSELITQIAPGVGLAYSTSMATYNSYQALSAAKSAHSIKNAHLGLLPEAPAAAFQAVRTLIERERNTRAAVAGTHGLEAAAKAAGIFLDAGAATGTAASIIANTSRLAVNLYLLKKDWDETRAVKDILQKPWEIDNSIFAKSPLLGCYFLLSADTWMIVNLVCQDFGKPGFKYQVEQAVKQHLNPLMNVAGQCILNHRMTLTGPVPKLSVIRDDELNQIAVRSSKLSDKASSYLYNKILNKGRMGNFK
ncbi:MAG: hypothetical protein OQJ89_16150 [Kangiellaceae bacterium]|nr:hypothetical protein [Kangiellaceae bacterium]MCW8999414.1 hypothetical protein [Kangiellaceae bacterium]MCW9018506.1 hypothetical protein [Kangiellaceae bacterium]